MRLQRFLAFAGIASRRKSEDLIAAGVVSVNDRVVTRPGCEIDPGNDVVVVQGRRVRPPETTTRTCLLLHKPAGVATTRADPGGGKTVYDYVTEPPGERLIYVGRLDVDTEGLLLFTGDGELAHRLTHPAHEVPRRYRVVASEDLDLRALKRAAGSGLMLEEGRTAPYRVIDTLTGAEGAIVELELREGKKREVRRMIAACGGSVRRLVRTRFAFLTLEGVAKGSCRRLSEAEIERLYAMVELGPLSAQKVR